MIAARPILVTGPSPGLAVTAKILAALAVVWLICWLAERALRHSEKK